MVADEHERRKSRKRRPLSEVVHEARLHHQEKRARQVKQPWLVLKLAVGLALAVIGYACYVYIGRLCVPMLRRDQDALGSLGLGVTFLVIFILLGFMMIWSYIKVLFTPPGFAKDVVPKSSPPNYMTSIPNGNNPGTHEAADNASNESTIGVPYETTSKPSTDTTHSTHHSHHRRSSGPHGNTSSKPRSGAAEHPSSSIPTSPPLSEKPANDPRGAAHHENGHAPDARPPHERRTSGQQWRKKLTREPPLMPILDPQYRYCKRCCLVKPPRTHHCRQCGTCVLGFDHHCPWIGQCVGARNHKYFVTFIFWTTIFCLWTFATLVGLNAKNDPKPGKHVDPQHIVVIVLAGMFSIFTVAMMATIASLITVSQTTVEHIGFRSMNEHEKGILAELHPWWDCLGKRRTRREWDREWGRIGFEGNLWWHGSIRAHWEEVMGTNVWTWLLPIGRGASDGVNYVPNPRFDAQGRWRPRREWPVDLQ